jgi:hypothetical protein
MIFVIALNAEAGPIIDLLKTLPYHELFRFVCVS